MNRSVIEEIITAQAQATSFSGVILVKDKEDIIYAEGYGLAYRAESIPNTLNTRFATASGTKIFTATAICQLVEQGKFELDTPLRECLKAEVPPYDPAVTIHHLLSHTSGIPDYLDEDTMTDADYTALYAQYPVYTMKRPSHYLSMFPHDAMQFKPGERFKYCNGAYILLALLIEEYSKGSYQQYVEQFIFSRAGMTSSGFFEMDCLPKQTAFGYIHDKETDTWRTNIFSLPILGGGDGGAYVTAPDMTRFWDALLNHKLLNPTMTQRMLTPHIAVDKPKGNRYYGYGTWISTNEQDGILRYSAIGSDQGVNFVSSVFPQHNAMASIIGNTSGPTWSVFKKILEAITA